MEAQRLSTFLLPDSRTLAYAVYGTTSSASSEFSIFYFHGFPSSRLEATLWDDGARKAKIQLIAIDRPGMGHSTFQENRSLLDWPKDVIDLADHLNIREFGLLGVSGGGPYVLSCLRAIPKERLKVGAVVCGVCPLKLGASDMLFTSRALFWAGQWVPWLLSPLIDWQLGCVARDLKHPDRFINVIMKQLMGEGLPQVDKNHFKHMFEDRAATSAFIEAVRESLRESAWGMTWEARLFGGDWGFELTEVDASRLIVWHGAMDANVPIGMVDKAVGIMKSGVYHRLEEEGHASLGFGRVDEDPNYAIICVFDLLIHNSPLSELNQLPAPAFGAIIHADGEAPVGSWPLVVAGIAFGGFVPQANPNVMDAVAFTVGMERKNMSDCIVAIEDLVDMLHGWDVIDNLFGDNVTERYSSKGHSYVNYTFPSEHNTPPDAAAIFARYSNLLERVLALIISPPEPLGRVQANPAAQPQPAHPPPAPVTVKSVLQAADLNLTEVYRAAVDKKQAIAGTTVTRVDETLGQLLRAVTTTMGDNYTAGNSPVLDVAGCATIIRCLLAAWAFTVPLIEVKQAEDNGAAVGPIASRGSKKIATTIVLGELPPVSSFC